MEAVKEKVVAKNTKSEILLEPPEIDLSDLNILLPKDESNHNLTQVNGDNSTLDHEAESETSTTTALTSSDTTEHDGLIIKVEESKSELPKIHKSVSIPSTSCQPDLRISTPAISSTSLHDGIKDQNILWGPFNAKTETPMKRMLDQTVEEALLVEKVEKRFPATRTYEGHLEYLKALQKYWRASERLAVARKETDRVSKGEKSAYEFLNESMNPKGWRKLNFFRQSKAKVRAFTSQLRMAVEADKEEKAALKELKIATQELQIATQNCIPKVHENSGKSISTSNPSTLSKCPWEDSKARELTNIEHLWNMYEGLNQIINPCSVEGKISAVISADLSTLYSPEARRIFVERLNAAVSEITESLSCLDEHRCFLKQLHLQNSIGKASNPTQYTVSSFETFEKHFTRFINAIDRIQKLIKLPPKVCSILEDGINKINTTLQAKNSAANLIAGLTEQNSPDPEEFVSKLYKPLEGNFFTQLQQDLLNVNIELLRNDTDFWKLLSAQNDMTMTTNRTEASTYCEEIDISSDSWQESTSNFDNLKIRIVSPVIGVKKHIKLPYSWDHLTRLISTDSQMELLNAHEKEANNQLHVRFAPSTKSIDECVEGFIIPSVLVTRHPLSPLQLHHKRCRSPPPPREHFLEWRTKFPNAAQHPEHNDLWRLALEGLDQKPFHAYKKYSIDLRSPSSSSSSSSSSGNSDDEYTKNVRPSTAFQNVSAEIKCWARRKGQQLSRFANVFKKR